MKSKKYYELVRRYEREASAEPERFHRRLMRQLWLGYGYIVLVMLVSLISLLVAIVVAWNFPHLVTIIGVLVVGGIAFFRISELFTPLDSIAGIQVTADQCPQLFEEINSLREQMDIPMISQVVITDELNAHAGEYRSRFFFGTEYRFLGIGLPMFQILNVDEMRSVIAHEIAHLARGHSRLSATFWHLRASWFNLIASGGIWWRWFANYFGNHFEAMASVIAREHELEADRIAFHSVGTKATVSGQLLINVLSRITEEPFQDWLQQQTVEPNPPANVVTEFLDRLKQPLREEQCLPLLRRVAAGETSIYETHPSIKDRIVRAGFVPRDSLQETAEVAWDIIQNRPEVGAAEHFLGCQFASFVEQLDSDYQQRYKTVWQAQHQTRQDYQNELKTIEKEIAESRTPATEFQLERQAQMRLLLEGTEAGHEAFKDLLVRFPENPAALFHCGQHAYYQDTDPKAAQSFLLKAMESDPRYESSISFMMIEICRELENPQEAERWQEYSFGAADAIEESMTERASITKKDKFLPAELTPQQVALIVDQLKAEKKVMRVWAARKKVEYYGDKPLYVFAIEVKYIWFWVYSEEYFNQVILGLLQTTRFPNEFFLLHLHSSNKVFRKKFKKLGKKTACIYSRKG